MNANILNRIKVLVKKTYYTNERFQVSATFALLYHEEPLNVIELSKYVRISDHLIQVDENHYFIIFAFTEQENAYKAAQNIIHNLDSYSNNHTTCIAVDAFDKTKTPENVLNRLKQILKETRKSSYIRVETDDILDR
ncbi:MAG: hypothetical protein JZU62_10910 [Sulfuricurvum sp.]|uniref:hypothetical protein n=1 Tax=Sulfuricurvum sp. TaxID=2025608 RepID=UPI0025F0861E|nr:hypothetical protein [Sulfuricurvum sp.]MBV5322193.1 hypothetical protein [Sulfuricurvum sp.]